MKKTEWILENSLTQGLLKDHQNIIMNWSVFKQATSL